MSAMKKLLLISVAVGAALLLAAPSAALAKDDAKATQRKPAPVKKKTVKKAAKPAARPTAQPVASAPKPSTDVQRALTKAGDYRFVIQHDGHARTYRVHVPQRYSPAEPAPLLVALHSGDGARPGNGNIDDLARESERHGFIAVFPDGYTIKGKPAGWNAGACCGDAQAQKVNDVGFIEQVVNNVFKQASVDRQRIYAAGAADGGTMAYRLACDLPEVFKAVASVGGTDNTTACTPSKPVSVLHLHAGNESGKSTPVATAKATAAKWAELNRCEPAPRRILDQPGAYCEAYTYCQRSTAVQLCVTDAGGQASSQPIEATTKMVGFFNSR
jgi:polyhydroxybutyrate depolymerase